MYMTVLHQSKQVTDLLSLTYERSEDTGCAQGGLVAGRLTRNSAHACVKTSVCLHHLFDAQVQFNHISQIRYCRHSLEIKRTGSLQRPTFTRR